MRYPMVFQKILNVFEWFGKATTIADERLFSESRLTSDRPGNGRR
jgi:hypothetical protein